MGWIAGGTHRTLLPTSASCAAQGTRNVVRGSDRNRWGDADTSREKSRERLYEVKGAPHNFTSFSVSPELYRRGATHHTERLTRRAKGTNDIAQLVRLHAERSPMEAK